MKDQILTKFIYMLKIHLKQSINCLLIDEEKYELRNQKPQKHSLIIYKQLMMFMKI